MSDVSVLARLRILVVDDEPLIRSLICNTLRRMRISQLVEAADGTLGLAEFQADPNCFDLIICDWNMPGLSGMDLCKAVRAARPDLPFLIVTGREDAESVAAAMEAGVSAYILKPFSPQELKAKIAYVTGDQAPHAAE
jgi:DNA-binding response OmpR family regulator